jgi:hypothetical protein
VASFYDGTIEVGLAFTFLTSAIILLILTSQNDYLRKSSFMLVGSILAFNYLVFPPSWPMGVFVIFHIIGTSGRIGLNIFRLFFGIILIVLSYFGLMYLIHYTTWDKTYLPFYGKFELLDSYFPLYILTPIALMLLYSLSDHFKHYNEKSPISRYKYTFVLVFPWPSLSPSFFIWEQLRIFIITSFAGQYYPQQDVTLFTKILDAGIGTLDNCLYTCIL